MYMQVRSNMGMYRDIQGYYPNSGGNHKPKPSEVASVAGPDSWHVAPVLSLGSRV